MRKHLTVISLLAIFVCRTVSLFAQDTDPRTWCLPTPRINLFYEVPPGNLTYENPNHKTMEYHFRFEVVDVEPNFRVHPSNSTQSEVPITRGLDPNILFASANTYNTGTGLLSEGVYVSTDGGNSWFGSDTCTALPIAGHGGDPGPGVGPDGRLYMSYLPYFYNGIKATYSTNFGATWTNPATLQTGSMDKNHTAVDNVPGSPYGGNAYVTWTDFSAFDAPISVSYTTDGGTTWSAYQHINSSLSGHYSQGCNGAAGPGGVVYVTWANPISGSPYTEDYIGFAISTDGGASWSYNNNVYDCNGIRGYLQFTGVNQIRVNGFPWMAVDNTGGPSDGWIYIVTGERNLAPAGSDPDIVMHVSSDGGTTWSAGIRVNQDPVNNGQYQYMPAVCVGEDGAVNVVYYDTRNATLTGGLPDSAQIFISRSTDGGTTFEDILVSDHRFKPKSIAGLATGYQGDYIGIAESNGIVYPYWCDDVSGIYQAWTTRVIIELPCPVEAASNPNPPSGTVDVDINLSQLTWDNGAGSVTNELYFGTNPTALDLVQSGSLATSWTIDPGYLPLDYYTTYYWKVVEIGDTCNNSITFNFKTIQDPNFVIATDTLYPQSAQYWTGNTEGSTKTDGEINTVYPNLGWAAYDISTIPSEATVTAVSFTGYVNANNWPYWSVTPMGTVNPITDGASVIYSQIDNNSGSDIAYIYSNESGDISIGYHSYPMENSALPDLQDAVTSSQGWFAMGFVDRNGTPNYYINFDGWSQPHPPYIIVDYNFAIVPAELTLFTASANNGNVSLNWETATETNNKGFEIERKSANSEYQKVGYVAGFGTTVEPKSYTYSDNNLKSGDYTYRLRQVDLAGGYQYSNEVEVNVNIPAVFSLEQNYPNPFNPTTMIQYSIPSDQQVRLNIYNLLGEKVITLVDGFQKAGQHEANFNAPELASGIYFYRLRAGNYISMKKMILLK